MNTESVKNRGYFKIKDAASAFNFDFKNKIVLDIGSSTGGFTQYALDQGAKKVIAIEKGTNQMKPPLRDNPRVELYEKTDIFRVGIRERSIEDRLAKTRARRASATRDARPLGREWPKANGPARSASEMDLSLIPDIIIADVSFISLTKVLKYAKMNLSRSNTHFLVMLKPQFEAKANQLNNGIVKNESIRREIIKNFEQWLKTNSFIIINKKDNIQKGKHGNIERFYHLGIAK